MATVLIIEDEIPLQEAYKYLFRHQGYKVETASDGEEGLEKALKVQPDLIILDMMMPNLNGLGFLQKYDTKKHSNVKIILLSNMQSPQYESEAHGLGIYRYEIKSSLSPSDLLNIAKQALTS